MRSLKILFSAYACEPGKGSEPGVGWRWALETARLGHEVWVVTRENNGPGIERGWRAAGSPQNLHFTYYDLPRWARWWKRGGRGVRLYYLLWQWGAYRFVRGLAFVPRLDAVHHITFGVIRHPSFMGRLGIPFVIGPLGGGERTPFALRRHFPILGQLKELARDVANVVAKIDPTVLQMFQQADLILLRTPESMAWLAPRFQSKASCGLEIGIDVTDVQVLPAPTVQPGVRELRLLYVGRFLHLKGMGLGLRAVANLQRRGLQVTLSMIGQGPEQEAWRKLAYSLGIANSVTWIPWMTQQDLLNTYPKYDVLLFPSLHDSGGSVVLEAMANGLPVVCLSLGGPYQMVNASCGRVVDVAGMGEVQVVTKLTEALAEIAQDAELAECLRRGARARAVEMSWAKVVGRVWGEGGIGYLAATRE